MDTRPLLRAVIATVLRLLFRALLLLLGYASGASGQVPASPPYRIQPLNVTHGDITLAGTLTMPDEPGPGGVPAVVLLTGSGAQNRDEEVFGFKVFGVLADALTRRGIAVYRHDDRGVGGSTGSIATSTTEDFADDALAALARLKSVPGINPARIGLLGHSEGAVAAAIAAAKSPDVAFIVMLAGTGVPGDQVLRRQARDLSISNGATAAQADRIVAAHQAATDAILRGAAAEERLRLVRALVEAQVDAAPPAQLAQLPDRAAYVEQASRAGAAQMAGRWMTFLLAFDPASALRQIKAPVYAAFGALDVQVPPSLNEAPVRAALGGNPRAVVTVYPDANHLFQRAKTGFPSEYASLDQAFVTGLVDDIARWIAGTGL